MTQAIAASSSRSRFGMRQAGLWTSAAAIVLAAHVTAGYALQRLNFTDAQGGGPPPALAIELAPLPSTPSVPEDTALLDMVSPEPPNAAEETEKPTELKPVTDATPEPIAEETEPVTEQPVDADKAEEVPPAETGVAALSEQPPPLEEVVPDVVETVAPAVVIPLPEPKPLEAKVKASKPVEAKKTAKKKPVEKPKQRPKKENAAPPRTVMTASIDAKAGAKAAAPPTSGRSGDPSKWNAKMRAWIKGHTRSPSAAVARRAEGIPYVTFTVDLSGRVLSARLTRSSGDADLDRAAVSVFQGATVPAPTELGRPQSRTVPIEFVVRN
jgi:protein TonB